MCTAAAKHEFPNRNFLPCHSVGYGDHLIPKPELYDILINSIPKERILLGKRILSFTQNEDNGMIQCSDNTSFNGNIFVGADSASSAVRQQLYKDLKVNHNLPTSDDVFLPYSCVCLVGQTGLGS